MTGAGFKSPLIPRRQCQQIVLLLPPSLRPSALHRVGRDPLGMAGRQGEARRAVVGVVASAVGDPAISCHVCIGVELHCG